MDGELLSGEPKKDFDWNGGLRRLLTDEVIIKPEVQNKYQDFVMHNVKEIYKFINREEPRFSSEMILTGSVKQRLNVHLPDQYDFNGLKQGKRTKRRRHRHYGLTGEYGVDPDHMHDDVIRTEVPVKVNLAIGEDFVNLKERDADMMLWGDSSDMVRDGDVVPYLVLLKLYHLLTRAGKEINNIKGRVMSCDYCSRIKGPAITVKIKYKDLTAAVDFAPVVLDKLPFPPKACWPRRTTQWPTPATARHIKE